MDTAATARRAAPPHAAVADWRSALRAAFLARPDTPKLLRGHARLVDGAVRDVWRRSGMPSHAALVAVGGYGRGQLYPHSDVDVLILLRDGDTDPASIERFLATLWDVG